MEMEETCIIDVAEVKKTIMKLIFKNCRMRASQQTLMR